MAQCTLPTPSSASHAVRVRGFPHTSFPLHLADTTLLRRQAHISWRESASPALLVLNARVEQRFARCLASGGFLRRTVVCRALWSV